MSTYDKHIAEDIAATNVGNVSGLKTDPIGTKKGKANPEPCVDYKEANSKTSLKKLKEDLEKTSNVEKDENTHTPQKKKVKNIGFVDKKDPREF